jgi:hypothetical protein
MIFKLDGIFNMATTRRKRKMKVSLYKVTIPSWAVTWFPYSLNHICLNVSFLREDAEKYIEEYPNLFLRPLLSIEPTTVDIQETD